MVSISGARVLIIFPNWREATSGGGHEQLPRGPPKINRPADNDCADERPNKCAEPFISRPVADNDAEPSTS